MLPALRPTVHLGPLVRAAPAALAGAVPIGVAVALATLVASGCLASRPPLGPASATPVFDPAEFFVGRSTGTGELSIRARGTEPVRVESVGTELADGRVRLVQTIRRGDGEPTERTWVLERQAPGRWTGTLTEARGPVEATVDGNELRIRYRTGPVTTVRQRLRLQPGGRVALNHLSVRVLGVPVARLAERIEKAE